MSNCLWGNGWRLRKIGHGNGAPFNCQYFAASIEHFNNHSMGANVAQRQNDRPGASRFYSHTLGQFAVNPNTYLRACLSCAVEGNLSTCHLIFEQIKRVDHQWRGESACCRLGGCNCCYHFWIGSGRWRFLKSQNDSYLGLGQRLCCRHYSIRRW